MIYSLAPSVSGTQLRGRMVVSGWGTVQVCWTDSSASESEVQAAALFVDLPPVKSPVLVKKRLLPRLV